MMRAQLHNGVELTFPDGTPDKVIQRTVRNFLGENKEEPPRKDASLGIMASLFETMHARFDEIRNAILSIPKPKEPEKVNLAPLEKAAAGTSTSIDELSAEVLRLTHVLETAAKATPIDLFTPPARDIQRAITSAAAQADANAKANEKIIIVLKNEIATLTAMQTEALQGSMNELKNSVAAACASVESQIHEQTKDIVGAIFAPKEIVKDREGRPIGVKVSDY